MLHCLGGLDTPTAVVIYPVSGGVMTGVRVNDGTPLECTTDYSTTRARLAIYAARSGSQRGIGPLTVLRKLVSVVPVADSYTDCMSAGLAPYSAPVLERPIAVSQHEYDRA